MVPGCVSQAAEEEVSEPPGASRMLGSGQVHNKKHSKNPATVIRPLTTYLHTQLTQNKLNITTQFVSRNWKPELPELSVQLPGVHCPATAFGCDGDRGETYTICKQ